MCQFGELEDSLQAKLHVGDLWVLVFLLHPSLQAAFIFQFTFLTQSQTMLFLWHSSYPVIHLCPKMWFHYLLSLILQISVLVYAIKSHPRPSGQAGDCTLHRATFQFGEWGP